MLSVKWPPYIVVNTSFSHSSADLMQRKAVFFRAQLNVRRPLLKQVRRVTRSYGTLTA